MRKHFLILMLLALLPLAGWSAVALDYSTWTVTLSSTYSTYDGTEKTLPTITLTKQGEDAVPVTNGTNGWVVAWDTEDWTNAGTKTVTVTNTDENITAPTANTATYTIVKKQVVYFLTGGTYAVGDEPDVTRHYSLANPGANNFAEGEELADYASFTWADTGNDQLDLDENGRFAEKKTYNITALKVVPNPGINQNYDFRFTSTAVIVVTGKSIAGFVADPVAAQQYTGAQITPDAVSIYATEADQTAELPLDPANYDVTYGANINVGTTGGTIIYTGKGNYEGTLEVPFAITKRELVKVTVAEVADRTYDYGAEIEPTLTVTGEDEDGHSYTLADTDYTVDYNGTNINVSVEGATGEQEAAEGGNFTFAEGADVDNATFTIIPKNLSDDDIAIADIDPVYYTAAGNEPNTTVNWTIGENENDITEFISFEYDNNTNAGTATIIASVNGEVEGAENYTGSTSANFMILPTSIDQEGIQITLKKWNADDEAYTTDAEYQYEGRTIRPGVEKKDDILVDGAVIVSDGEILLEEGKDYEIVAYTDAAYADYDNENANDNAAVIIKGKGNYGKIDALANAITKTETFQIAKRTLVLTAKEASTTFGISPANKFGYTDNTVEEGTAEAVLGGVVTYVLTKHVTGQDDEEVDEVDYENLPLTSDETTYTYEPRWTLLPAEADIEQEGDPFASTEQIAARDNYDFENEESVDYVDAALVVNAAKWIIVPDNQTKKYGVADDALTFTYKVYAGETLDDAELVPAADVAFDDAEPIFGRSVEAQGENVVNGGYEISIQNENAVSKEGYTLEYETATLTIVPFPITITANNQSIYYGDDANLTVTETSKVKDIDGDEDGFGNLLTVEIYPAMYGNQHLINRVDLGLTLKYAEDYDGKAGLHEGALVPAITNPNFIATPVNGDLLVEAAGDLLLSETDDDLAGKIAAANDGEDKVITFDDITMLEKEWYAMVLPFATTPAELVGKLGTYVVVNTLKSSTIDNGIVTVNFGIEMDEIPAGTPFLIKPAQEVSWEDAQFVAPVTEEITDAESDYATFTGVYETGKSVKWGLELDGTTVNADKKYRWLANSDDARPNTDPVTYYENKWYNCKNNAHALTPMEAFLILDKTATGARVFVEDFENGTTAIQSLNADEINGLKTSEGWYTIDGIKLQSAPVEKGVYINNGKKVVIK